MDRRIIIRHFKIGKITWKLSSDVELARVIELREESTDSYVVDEVSELRLIDDPEEEFALPEIMALEL